MICPVCQKDARRAYKKWPTDSKYKSTLEYFNLAHHLKIVHKFVFPLATNLQYGGPTCPCGFTCYYYDDYAMHLAEFGGTAGIANHFLAARIANP